MYWRSYEGLDVCEVDEWGEEGGGRGVKKERVLYYALDYQRLIL